MENNNKKLKAKDFITVGIFTAILFVLEFGVGMLGYIHPYIVASYVIILPLISGIDRLEDCSALAGVAKVPARVKCAVLAWHTLEDALN